ncbi:MAG: DUF3139 domain-containing protein [Clostridia bacterium]|nr:DUF3139 domain-containing protein [Clostridia bacterium]
MKKKRFKIIAIILVTVVLICSAYVFMGAKKAEKLTWEYLKAKGYTAEQIKKIDINHSFLNIILSYNEWIIKVEFVDEPNVFYIHTIKDGKIVETGVSGDVDKENLKHRH